MAPVCSDTERDLHLAAQLGRALLERNNELEEMIREQELDIDQKNSEIQFLTKHVEMLREDFESCLLQEEQNSQQREGKIAELEAEKKFNQESIKKFKSRIDELEAHSAELEKEIDKFTATQKTMTKPKCHCNLLSPTYDSTFADEEQQPLPICQSTPTVTYNREMMKEIKDLEHHIGRLQSELNDCRAMYKQEKFVAETLRRDLEQTDLEKSSLEDQLTVLKHKECSSKSFEAELRKWRQETGSLENKSSLENECEFEELDIQKGVLIKLGNGVQAYGREDSFSSEDEFGQLEDSDTSRRPSLLEELLHDDNPPPSLTPPDSPQVVNENVQKNCAGDYSQVFGLTDDENYSTTAAVQTEERCCNDWSEDIATEEFEFQTVTNPFENSFRKTPEYKSLFQEIFMVLKRTVGSYRPPKKEAIQLSVFGK